MDENLYDEFGNYIGPQLESSGSDSDSEVRQRLLAWLQHAGMSRVVAVSNISEPLTWSGVWGHTGCLDGRRGRGWRRSRSCGCR